MIKAWLYRFSRSSNIPETLAILDLVKIAKAVTSLGPGLSKIKSVDWMT